MATLVMTIDSDSEGERPVKRKNVAEEDEEIVLGHTVIMGGDKNE
jgi:primosomal protein N'